MSFQPINPLEQELKRYQQQKEELQLELAEVDAKLADFLRRLRIFEADFRAAVDDVQQKLHRWERRCAILEELILQLEQIQWGNAPIPIAVGPWVDQIEQKILPPPDDSVSVNPIPQLSTEDSKTAKNLYRKLAKRFHPDLISNEECREERRELMANINEAYQKNDLQALQELQHHPDIRDPNDETHGQSWERLVREIALLQKAISKNQQLLSESENSELAKLMVELGENQNSARFSDLREVFIQRMKNYCERWKRLRQREAQLWLEIDK